MLGDGSTAVTRLQRSAKGRASLPAPAPTSSSVVAGVTSCARRLTSMSSVRRGSALKKEEKGSQRSWPVTPRADRILCDCSRCAATRCFQASRADITCILRVDIAGDRAVLTLPRAVQNLLHLCSREHNAKEGVIETPHLHVQIHIRKDVGMEGLGCPEHGQRLFDSAVAPHVHPYRNQVDVLVGDSLELLEPLVPGNDVAVAWGIENENVRVPG